VFFFFNFVPRTNYRNRKPVLYTELGSLSTRGSLNTFQVAKLMRSHPTVLIPKLMPLPNCSVHSQNFIQHLQQGGPLTETRANCDGLSHDAPNLAVAEAHPTFPHTSQGLGSSDNAYYL